MKDYYAILQVSCDATQEMIRQQYRLLVRSWHPDKFTDQVYKMKAEEKTKEINEAYGVLKDAAKRAEYNRERELRLPQPVGPAGVRPAEPTRSAQRDLEHLHYEFYGMVGDNVVVILNQPANIVLLDTLNYYRYKKGDLFTYIGGYAEASPVVFQVPYWGKWHLAIDLGGAGGTLQASVRVVR